MLMVLGGSIREENVIRGTGIGKEKTKQSLFADHIIIYIENPNYPKDKLLEVIGEFSSVAGYKINIKISCISLYQ